MKKFMLLMVAAILGIGTMSAEKGEKTAGINLNYGSEVETIGLGVKFQYGFTNEIRGEAAFNHFFEKNGFKLWNLDVTAHYLFPLSEKTTFYPLAGLCFVKGSAGEWSNSEWGANLGGGIEFALVDNFTLDFEAKYQLVSDMDQAIISIGLNYKF